MFHHSQFGIRSAGGGGFTNSYSADFERDDSEEILFGVNDLDFLRTDAFSVFAWVKPESLTGTYGGMVINNRYITQYVGWSLSIDSGGVVHFYFRDSSGRKIDTKSTTTVNTATWAHIGFGYPGDSVWNNVRFWIDGSGEAPNNNASSELIASTATADELNIGGHGLAALDPAVYTYFDGIIGDVITVNKKLSDGEAAEVYNLNSEVDMDTTSFWGAAKSNANSFYVNWEADTFDAPNGVIDLSDNGFTGSAQNMTDATNLVGDNP